MSAVELLPCPFCNEPPTVLKKGNELTRMSVTILCPKCRAERTDATPKAFNHANHDWLLAVATKNWNKRPIAPPVAAGSVDTLEVWGQLDGELSSADCAMLFPALNAWGAQQREAGRQEGRRDAHETNIVVLGDCLKAEARVKELEAGRQALQAEGKHPAPCARDCEANAFQIEVRRLQAVELNMHRKLAAEKLRADQGWARYEAANRAKNDLERERGHKQSIIDRLMLEYCPDEMTAEQVTEWASHQKRAE